MEQQKQLKASDPPAASVRVVNGFKHLDSFNPVCQQIIHHRVLTSLCTRQQTSSLEAGQGLIVSNLDIQLPIRANSCQVVAKRLCKETKLEHFLTRIYPNGIAEDKWLTSAELTALQQSLAPIQDCEDDQSASSSCSQSDSASLLSYSYYCSSSSSSSSSASSTVGSSISSSVASASSTSSAISADGAPPTPQPQPAPPPPPPPPPLTTSTSGTNLKIDNLNGMKSNGYKATPNLTIERSKRRLKRFTNFTVRAPDCYDRVCQRVIHHRILHASKSTDQSRLQRQLRCSGIDVGRPSWQLYRGTTATAVARRCLPDLGSQVLVRHYPLGVFKEQWMSEVEFAELKLIEAKEAKEAVNAEAIY